MATGNALFDPGREGFLDGSIDFNSSKIVAALCKGYTFDPADIMVSHLTNATLVNPTTLTNVSVTNGVADCDMINFGTVAQDNTALTCIIVYQATAVRTLTPDVDPSLQRLICYIDTLANNAAMTVTPNGTQVTFTPDPGANGLFKL